MQAWSRPGPSWSHILSPETRARRRALDATRRFLSKMQMSYSSRLFVPRIGRSDGGRERPAGRRIRRQSWPQSSPLQVEPEESIRRVLIGSLWRSRKAESKVIDAVASIAKGDPSQDLRSRAELLLLAYAKEQMEAVNKSRLPEPAFR